MSVRAWCRVALLAAAAVAAGPVALARQDREPEYRGRKLSAWAEQLRSPDAGKRAEAATVLGDFRERALPALDALVAALADRDGKVKSLAAQALGHIGPGAAKAVPALIE